MLHLFSKVASYFELVSHRSTIQHFFDIACSMVPSNSLTNVLNVLIVYRIVFKTQNDLVLDSLGWKNVSIFLTRPLIKRK